MGSGAPLALLLVGMVLIGACGPQRAPTVRPGRADEGPGAGPKRITVAILSGDPVMLRSSAVGPFGGTAAGIDSLEDLVHAGLSRRDDTDTLRPLLGESVPSTENGLWQVFPDGRMETSWTLKNGATWHDGAAFTTDDLLFTLGVCTDREMAGFCGHVAFEFLEAARASDSQTITVSWKQPFIEADALFTTQMAMPLPKHLLERSYRESKLAIAELTYFNRDFVGTGPFRVREWIENSHMVISAFERYILGRPKIDEIVVKYITDSNTIVANMLAGEIDVNLGRGVSPDQAIQIRDLWGDGRLEVGLVNWIVLYPQFIDPRPAVLLDVRFRRALIHSVDRQEMADALHHGLTPVRHAYFDTSQPRYRDLDPFVVKYQFDARRAAQLIESTGYIRGSDGAFRDPAGQHLSLDIRTPTAGQAPIQLSVADYWQRTGIVAETLIIPPGQVRDSQYRATRPGFEMFQISDGVKGLRRAHSSETPLPENNFLKVNNTSRYMNPEFDAMLDRFFATVPFRERMQVLGQILQHTTEQVTLIPLFYGPQPMLVNGRLVGIGARKAAEGTDAWNAHEWDVR